MPALLLLVLVQEGEFTPFSINTGLIFWTIVVFGILLALLWRFGWAAILKAGEGRGQRIQRPLEEAERARAGGAPLLGEHQRTIATAQGGAAAVKSTTIARNYAEALLLAAEAGSTKTAVELYGRLMDAVAGAVQADERIAVALDSPRVAKATKAALLERALGDVTPPEFVRFLQAVLRRGRQGLLGEIAHEYQALVDAKLNRVHAGVVLVEQPDGTLEQQIVERLTAAIGKDVRAHFRADRGILGGVVVRVGDRVYDGSLKRKLAVLRRKMLTGE